MSMNLWVFEHVSKYPTWLELAAKWCLSHPPIEKVWKSNFGSSLQEWKIKIVLETTTYKMGPYLL